MAREFKITARPTVTRADYVTVTFQTTREGLQDLLAKESLIQPRYTALGITWSGLMQAIRDALNNG